MFPIGLQYPTPIITNDTYIPPRMTDATLISSLLPISPIPLSPISVPFMPSVINIPNI